MSLITSSGTKAGVVSDHTRLVESLLPVLIPGLSLSFPDMLLTTGRVPGPYFVPLPLCDPIWVFGLLTWTSMLSHFFLSPFA